MLLLLGVAGLAAFGIVALRGHFRARTARSRHRSWDRIARSAPGGSTMVTVEGDAVMLLDVGRRLTASDRRRA